MDRTTEQYRLLGGAGDEGLKEARQEYGKAGDFSE